MAAAGGFDDAQQFWDNRFAAPEYIFGTEPNVFVASQATLFQRGMRVLDVGCGEGRNAVWLAERGCLVTGIDISPRALDKARALAAARGVAVESHQSDIRNWHWKPDSFEAAICIFIQFAAPEERGRLFEGLRATLEPGGLVLLQGYTPRQLEYKTGGPPSADHMYTADLLREAFAGFEVIVIREHEAHLQEGTKHVGRSALIDFVARKAR